MNEAIAILSAMVGMASAISIPLAVLIGLPLLSWNLRAFLGLKQREMELHRMQAALRLTESARGGIPAYVDLQSSEAVLAWAKVATEVQAH